MIISKGEPAGRVDKPDQLGYQVDEVGRRDLLPDPLVAPPVSHGDG